MVYVDEVSKELGLRNDEGCDVAFLGRRPLGGVLTYMGYIGMCGPKG